jgi:hypothetical protein
MKKLLIFTSIIAALIPFRATAIQYQNSPNFILAGSGNWETDGTNWKPRRLLINGNPSQRIEVKINTISSTPIEATSCGAVFIPIDTFRNSTGTITVDNQQVVINQLPTLITPRCRLGSFEDPRPNNYITRPDGSADGRYIVIVGKTPGQEYSVQVPQQRNQLVTMNACGWGLLPERIQTKRDKYGEIISRELIGLPENFILNNQTIDLRTLPIANASLPPFCRNNRNGAETFVPTNW